MINDFFEFVLGSYGPVVGDTLRLLIDTAVFWLPLVLVILLWRIWLQYIRAHFIHSQDPVLLEIKLPREVTKTPKAMERILTAMNQKSPPEDLIDGFWKGKVPPWFSLEMVSLGGRVHLYVWAWRKYKDFIESQFYSQYPAAEIHETEHDYASQIPINSDQYKMWGMQFELSNPDAYPIQTYIDLGMDKPGALDEDQKDDPMGPIIEYLGSLRRGEQAWIQILIQAHQKEGFFFGRLIPKPEWKERVQKEIQNLREKIKIPGPEGMPLTSTQPLTTYEGDVANAMQRNLDKFPFDACVRIMYLAQTNVYDGSRIPGLISTLRQVSSYNRNGFKPTWKTEVDHPFYNDFRGTRQRRNDRKYLDAYRRRSYFQRPYLYFKQKPFVLTTEELATLFHLPGQVVSTPTLERVSSRKGDAPSNIPTDQ